MNPTIKLEQVELNPEFLQALELLEKTSKNILITGKAGTGKSTLLKYFCSTTKKKIAVLAPTGVAALNVGGETIHSFFRFKPDVTVDKIKKVKGKKSGLYKNIDVIIIDEISMVRSDLLDCVDRFLRLNGKKSTLPFGGIQMVFIGDLYQLPPVVTGRERPVFTSYYKSQYFFDAKIFSQTPFEFIELEKVYRQKDDAFIQLLNSIRNNSITNEELNMLNHRVNASFENKDSGYSVHLTTTNDMAYKINQEYAQKIKSRNFLYVAEVYGEFDPKYYPTEHELNIKVGSQIMLLNNDVQDRWVNGSLGKIVNIFTDKKTKQDIIVVQLSDGEEVEVERFAWEIFHYQVQEETHMLETETVGEFVQYPLKLAWAVTIHKSQGKTFDRVIIDLGRGTFAHGQMYVALSRCTSLGGIVLKKPIEKKHIFMDWRVVNFLTKYQYAISEKSMPLEEKINAIQDAIKKQESLEIVYLKNNDIKSKRVIKPLYVGEKTYLNKSFLGLDAFCCKRNEERVFRVDRILAIKPG